MGNAKTTVGQIGKEGLACFTCLEVDDGMENVGWMAVSGRGVVVIAPVTMLMVLVRVFLPEAVC